MPSVLRVVGAAPRGRRYSSQVRDLARRMHDGGEGWSVEKIVQTLNDQDVPVRAETVRCWVDEDYRQRRQRTTSEARRRRRGDLAFLRRRLALLHDEHGLSRPQLAAIAAIYHGTELTADQVRYLLDGEQIRADQRARRTAA